MAKQRVVNTRFWDDDYVMALTPNEKLMFLYILTNSLTDLCGAYQITLRRIAFDTGLRPSKVSEILLRFETEGKILYKNGWMLVRNFAKHQVSNPKVTKGIERSLSHCPAWVKDSLSKPMIDDCTLTSGENPNLKGQPELRPEPSALDEIMTGLRERFKLNVLRDESGWSDSIVWALGEGFVAADFLECFDLLSRQKWRKGRITPKNVADNLPEIDKLRIAELEEQNGTNNANRNNSRPTSTDRLGEYGSIIDQYPTEAELRNRS